MKKIKKIIDTIVSNILHLSKQASKQANILMLIRKEVQLFSNCTFDRKESEGLSLCSSLVRGAFLC